MMQPFTVLNVLYMRYMQDENCSNTYHNFSQVAGVLELPLKVI